MRILIIPDSFKRTLSAAESVSNISSGIPPSALCDNIVSLLLSDGGEGFVVAFAKAWDISPILVSTKNPLNRALTAHYILEGNKNGCFRSCRSQWYYTFNTRRT